MQILLVLAFVAAVVGSASAQTCNTFGSSTRCDNGLSGQRLGNFTYWSNGSSSQRVGTFDLQQRRFEFTAHWKQHLLQ